MLSGIHLLRKSLIFTGKADKKENFGGKNVI
jgi:hypothetical protein